MLDVIHVVAALRAWNFSGIVVGVGAFAILKLTIGLCVALLNWSAELICLLCSLK